MPQKTGLYSVAESLRSLPTRPHLLPTSKVYLARSQFSTWNFVPNSSAITGHGWGIWTWVHTCGISVTTVRFVTSPISGARILGCERCRIVCVCVCFFSEVVFQRVEVRERRNLCLEVGNGRHSKKRSKAGNICFIRRISSVRLTFCNITEVIQMT